MTDADTAEGILDEAASGPFATSARIFTRDGDIASDGRRLRPVEGAIAAHGDEGVSKWKIEGMRYGSARATIGLQDGFQPKAPRKRGLSHSRNSRPVCRIIRGV